MIFVTVGMQMPFDRLCKAVDEWAGKHGRQDVFMQIGSTDWRPRHVEFTTKLDPSEFDERVNQAQLLVIHAGIGSIVSAIECGKPILVMPRRMKLRETRNDHQVATVNKLKGMSGVAVAMDEHELAKELDDLEIDADIRPLSASASPELLDKIRSFIHGES